jgi:peptidoglycan/LPS O-acetylase OafA/YrhL
VSSPSRERLLNLDLLRFLAVALVIGRHMSVPPVMPGWPEPLHQFFLVWERGGWVGVDLFFVLSGFLVSGLLFTEFLTRGAVSPLHFYVRRGWKIYPAFWCLLAVSVVLLPATGWPFSGARLASEMFFVQNYYPGLWNHTWSLAVEEHFYLLLPLLFWVVMTTASRSQSSLRPILYVAAATSLVVFAVRMINWQLLPQYTHSDHLMPTHLRLDSLMFGVVLAYGFHLHPAKFAAIMSPWRIALLPVGAACFIPAFVWPLGTNAFVHTAGFTLFQFGAGMLLVSALLLPAVTGFLPRLLARLGAYSYSIYLWHFVVIVHLMPFVWSRVTGSLPYPVVFLLSFAATMIVGVVLGKVIEFPALALRDRWFPSRSRPLGIPARPRPAAAGADRRVAV